MSDGFEFYDLELTDEGLDLVLSLLNEYGGGVRLNPTRLHVPEGLWRAARKLLNRRRVQLRQGLRARKAAIKRAGRY